MWCTGPMVAGTAQEDNGAGEGCGLCSAGLLPRFGSRTESGAGLRRAEAASAAQAGPALSLPKGPIPRWPVICKFESAATAAHSIFLRLVGAAVGAGVRRWDRRAGGGGGDPGFVSLPEIPGGGGRSTGDAQGVSQTSFLYFELAARTATSSLTFCAWLLWAIKVESSAMTTMESLKPTSAMGVRCLVRAS